jgi:hypothetical protein
VAAASTDVTVDDELGTVVVTVDAVVVDGRVAGTVDGAVGGAVAGTVVAGTVVTATVVV